MANALYEKGREGFLNGTISWSADSVRAVLVDTASYAVDLVAHEFLSDIATGARTAICLPFTAKTSLAGVAGADNIVFPAVTGNQSEALVIYMDTGNDATSQLVAYIDTATGLPVTPGGGDVNVTWDTGQNKIFKL